MYKRNKLLKRLTAGALAVCIVLSIGGVGEIISSIMENFSVTANAATSTVPEDMKINQTIEFTDDMDALSTTVLFNHWHLMKDGGKTTAVGVADEYRFYPLKDEKGDYIVSKNDEGEDIIKVYLLSKVDGTAGEFKLVEIYELDAENPDYSKVSFVISPQIPNPLGAEGADEKFSNFSISSGHDSATIYLASDGRKEGPNNDFYDFKYAYGAVGEEHFVSAEYPDGKYPDGYARVVVTYHPDSVNHVIKGHAFYVNDIVTMIGADFATETFFTIPEDAEGYDTADPDKNRLVENPYLVWRNGYAGDKNYESAKVEDNAKIVYTGEIDTHYYEYKTEDGRDKTVIYHNTSSGLHTNKTAYKIDGIDDGRTYDIGLETWYAGEDIADVGFILDASGSMAWSTNVLQPMEVTADKITALKDLLDKENKKLDDYVSIYNGADGYSSTAQKYLTTDEVNTILNIANTDNTRLSYSEYNYYIYEPRASVSEFVALGYWGGNLSGTPSVDKLGYKLIGYYPFDGNLNNAINSGSAKLIKHAENGVFNTTPLVSEAQFPFNGADGTGYELDLASMAQAGGLLINTDANVSTNNFTVSLRLSDDYFNPANNSLTGYTYGTAETPLLYIGNEQGTSYFEITKVGEDLVVHTFANNTKKDYTVKVQNNSVFATNRDRGWINLHLVFENGNLTVYVSAQNKSGNNNVNTWFGSQQYQTNLQIADAIAVLGGYVGDYDNSKFQNIAVTALCALNTAATANQVQYIIDQGKNGNNDGGVCANQFINNGNYVNSYSDKYGDVSDSVIAQYSFDVVDKDKKYQAGLYDGGITNNASSSNPKPKAAYIQQAKLNEETGNKEFDTNAVLATDASAVFADNALDVTETSKIGSVLLDVAPSSGTYTIAFSTWKDAGSGISVPNGADHNTYNGNLLYLGKLDKTDYYNLYRSANPGGGLYLDDESKRQFGFKGAFAKEKTWYYVTYVVEDLKNGYSKITPYVNGSNTLDTPDPSDPPFTVPTSQVESIIIAGIEDINYNGANLRIDDLCIFDEALSKEQVEKLYNSLNSSGAGYVVASGDHLLAFDDSGNIIGILNSGKNRYTDDYITLEQRKGWYYINSNSNWTQTTDEKVGTAKQLEGLYNDPFAGSIKIKDIEASVTIPKAHEGTELFSNGAEKGNATFQYPETKDPSKSTYGPSQFFLVEINGKYYLRCYFNSGSHSSNATTASEARTQCSYIYYKADDQRIKVETLQYAINSFAANLKNESPRSRLSGVRFSNKPFADVTTTGTNFQAGNANPSTLDKDTSIKDKYYKDEGKGAKNPPRLDHLVLLDWTKSTTSSVISARHGGDTAAGSKPSDPNIEDENNTKNGAYDPFDPISQQNYFLTGGTFTWTGLKAFYTQLASRDDRYYNGKPVTEEAEKYVILFTDGRDNMVTSSVNAVFVDAKDDADKNSANYRHNIMLLETGSDGTEDYSAAGSGKLKYDETGASLVNSPSKLWADKLKAEGYTVFCIMLASGSVSKENNFNEYSTALTYLSYLIAGPAYENAAKTDAELITHYYDDDANNMDNYVFVANGDESLAEVFDAILARINSKLDDYTVQDYIDPRFDLVEEQEIASVTVHQDATGKEMPEEECTHKYDVTYSSAHTHTIKLGAKGEIKLADCDTVYYKTDAAGKKTLIEKADLPDGITLSTYWTDTAPSGPLSDNNYYPYTALDGKPARLYYNDTDYFIDGNSNNLNNNNLDRYDAYYLKWVEVEIPGCAIGAPIVEVWSSKIRIKAKDDFIGGNDILTNGNLANMNYVYPTKTIDKYIKGRKVTLERTNSSGTNKADPQLEKAVGKYTPAGGTAEVEYTYADYLPSKGFPRVTVNVRLLPIYTSDLFSEMYMGEVVSPAQLLLDIEEDYMTESYYLEYLKRYAYQRYLSHLDAFNKILYRDEATAGEAKAAFDGYKAASDRYNEYQTKIDILQLQIDDLGYENIKLLEDLKNKKFIDGEEALSAEIDEYEEKIKELDEIIADDDATEEEKAYAKYWKSQYETWLNELRPYKTKLEKINDEIKKLEEQIDVAKFYQNAAEDEMSRFADKLTTYGVDEAKLEELMRLANEMDMPLLELLNEWMHINDTTIPKSFSIPYIYLPSVEYYSNADSEHAGKVKKDPNTDKAQNILNSTGNIYNRADVVGMLTYRWVQLDPVTGEILCGANGEPIDPTVEYVKDNTESIRYSLTVEFTPFETVYTAAEYGATEKQKGAKTVLDNQLDSIFSDYLGIDDDDIVLDKVHDEDPLNDYFSRLRRNNGNYKKNGAVVEGRGEVDTLYNNNGLIRETQSTELKAGGASVPNDLNTNVYRWDKKYKATVGNAQIEYKKDDGSIHIAPNSPSKDTANNSAIYEPRIEDMYGMGEIINRGRTIRANSEYTKDVVSGGIALELKVPVKDLEEILKSNGKYADSFTVKATRKFTDTDYAEKQKIAAKLGVEENGAKLYDDYTGNFYLTFTFNYDRQMIEKAIDSADNGYATLFARTAVDGVLAEWRYSEEKTDGDGNKVYTKKTKWVKLNELPIGTYDLNLAYNDDTSEYTFFNGKIDVDDEGKLVSLANEATFNGKRFTYVGDEKVKEIFKTMLPYTYRYDPNGFGGVIGTVGEALLFSEEVLNGLWTITADQSKTNKRTNIYTGKPLFSNQEINVADGQDHVTGYIAPSISSYEDRTATFYLGTDSSSKRSNRGNRATETSYPDVDLDIFDKDGNLIHKDASYLDDRLGILVLSLGDDELAVDKTVDRTSNADDYTMLWKFDITLKSPELLSSTGKISYKAKYFDYEDLDSNGKAYFKDKVFADGMEEGYDFYKAYAMGENGSIDAVSRDKNIYPETVTFSLQSNTKDNDGNYIYKATVYLTHYQKVLIQGMGWEYGINERNIDYTVQETGDKENIYKPYLDHYDVTMTKNGVKCANDDRKNIVNGYLGENADGSASVISYTNTFPYFVLPGNGGVGTHWYMITGICLILMSVLMFGYLYYRDRRHKRAKAR